VDSKVFNSSRERIVWMLMKVEAEETVEMVENGRGFDKKKYTLLIKLM